MREYQIDKVESYYIKANSAEEAKAIVAELDNSSAHKVSYEAVWAGSEEEVAV